MSAYLGDGPIPFSSARSLRTLVPQIGGDVGCVEVSGLCGIIEFLRQFFRLLVWRLRVPECGDIDQCIVAGY
jgi:hypothetical protein